MNNFDILTIYELWSSGIVENRLRAIKSLSCLSQRPVDRDLTRLTEILEECLYGNYEDTESLEIWTLGMEVPDYLERKFDIKLFNSTRADVTKYSPREAYLAEDCSLLGLEHDWYNCDNIHIGCYRCGKVIVGNLN